MDREGLRKVLEQYLGEEEDCLIENPDEIAEMLVPKVEFLCWEKWSKPAKLILTNVLCA